MKPASYVEIFFSDSESEDKWYKAKRQFITIDEKKEKEKRSNVYYLVQAASIPGAVKHVDEVMGSTMIDYVIASIVETQIMDVFEHHAPNATKQKKEEKNDVPEYEKTAEEGHSDTESVTEN